MAKFVHSGCGYEGRGTWDNQCPNCKSKIIEETLTVGERYDCNLKTYKLGEVKLIRLEQEEYDGRMFFNGLALVQPVRVAYDEQYGEPVYRAGTEDDQTHVGTVTLTRK